MTFENKFDKLGEKKTTEIIAYAKKNGESAASKKYYLMADMSERGLYRRLRKETGTKKAVSLVNKALKKYEEVEITEEEHLFLDRMGKGLVTLEETSSFVAVRVFEKMLRRPWEIKFSDWFKAELLKIKQKEAADRNKHAQNLLDRFFAGQLPPSHCPKCGHGIFDKVESGKIEEGEVVDGSK